MALNKQSRTVEYLPRPTILSGWKLPIFIEITLSARGPSLEVFFTEKPLTH